jgi:hypothetical protein
MNAIRIGTWHEKSRKIQAHTGYAADYINHQTKDGDYPAMLSDKWLLIKLGTFITDGKYYNGFGGVNYSSNKIKSEDSTYTLQLYAYTIPSLLNSGKLTLFPEFEHFGD